MPDLNPQQFRTLYHGTHAKHVDKIRAEGLKTPNDTYDSASWLMLTDSKAQAHTYANGGPVLEYHVPEHEVWRRGNQGRGSLWPGKAHSVYDQEATAYALKKPLSSDYLHTVHEGKER